MPNRNDDPASRPDTDNPEWTAAAVRKARPALEVVSEIFGPRAAEDLQRGRGRPAKANPKVNQTLRLDADVLDAWRRSGRGWQVRINQVLRDNMPNDREH